MSFNKNDILARLKNGDSLDTITKELTNALNDANTEYQKEVEAERARVEQTAAKKHEIMNRLVKDIRDFGVLEGIDPELLNVDENDIEAMVKMLSDTFASLNRLKKLTEQLPKDANDDEILNHFLHNLLN